ncbi:DUF397 domain-containing protein [Streptomyces sp. NBC_01314]|uniref:DUF397 domain-containing protein n=1 Tax=Streptomyces sp. NBC_01314 TaxID=2903821 RepID=UPI0030901ACF|nr:DUF397 domain-containing protein [Streptomyces sp. NBC_01314]
MTALPKHFWFKSSYSGGSGTECVECAHTGDATLIRDSKRSREALVVVRGQAWNSFTEALKNTTLGS